MISDRSPTHDLRRTWTLLFLFSPAIVIVAMAVIQQSTGSMSVIFSSIILFSWSGFLLSLLWRLRVSWLFFVWSSLVSAIAMVLVPFASGPLGLHLGRCDPFPAHLIMAPTVLSLILFSLVSVLVWLVGFSRKHFQGKHGRDGGESAQ